MRVSKILTLYDIEFKRIKKIYFSTLGLLILGNIVLFIFYLNLITKETENILNIKGGLKLLKSNEAYRIVESGEIIYSLYKLSSFFMTLGIIWCLFYSLMIWYKDFFSKTKVAYTLFTLPLNKFNIFLSKLIIVVSFIYGVVITQHIIWIFQSLIIDAIVGMNITEIIDIINYNNYINIIWMGGLLYPIEISMYYLIAPIALVTVMFTGVMIHKSFDKIGVFLAILYIILTGFFYIFISRNCISYTDELLKGHIFYYITVETLSLIMSYKLLNKRIQV